MRLPSITRNELQDITETLLTKVYNNVCVEHDPQPVIPDQLREGSANRQDGARLDIQPMGYGVADPRKFTSVQESANRNPGPSGAFTTHT